MSKTTKFTEREIQFVQDLLAAFEEGQDIWWIKIGDPLKLASSEGYAEGYRAAVADAVTVMKAAGWPIGEGEEATTPAIDREQTSDAETPRP